MDKILFRVTLVVLLGAGLMALVLLSGSTQCAFGQCVPIASSVSCRQDNDETATTNNLNFITLIGQGCANGYITITCTNGFVTNLRSYVYDSCDTSD